MGKKSLVRTLVIVVAALTFALVLTACGGEQDMSETNPGAPAGAQGSEAGGAAVEAGKQRPSDELEDEKKTYGEEPPPVQLQTGNVSGYKVKKPTVVIVNSKSELNDLRKKLRGPGVHTTVVPVDFKTRQIVAVVLPPSKAGDLLQVVQVNEKNGKIAVQAVRLTPGDGCKDTKPTNPFALVETRKMKGTPTVSFTDTPNSPCS